ncbi:MAG: acyltransferase, partial [Planctomycetaceae bacterium]|nr:acyltransferase [Planctomycetaceae bacterium]
MNSGGRAGICEAGPRWTELELQTDRTDSVEHLPALDGLRFLAALFVMFAHLPAAVFKTPTQSAWLSGTGTLAGLGMTTFFVLSGFVIHYNYRLISRQRGARLLWRFALARVARLYPLFLLVLGIDLLHAARVFPGNLDHAAHVLPFYITLTHAWTYGVSGDHSLI